MSFWRRLFDRRHGEGGYGPGPGHEHGAKRSRGHHDRHQRDDRFHSDEGWGRHAGAAPAIPTLCARCNAPLADDARFCPRCGTQR
jgi:hypothetical protein